MGKDQQVIEAASTPVERMYFAWNEALARNDADALLALYAKDAHFRESPRPSSARHRERRSGRP